jgi:hypothetical protein
MMEVLIKFFNTFGLDLLRCVIVLFVFIDPLGTNPFFVTITDKQLNREKMCQAQM